MFFWWQRFASGDAFRKQKTMFGPSDGALKNWWKETTDKLYIWAKKTMINDGPEELQEWTAAKIIERTTNFIKRIHDPENEGKIIVVMDGTYIFTQEVQVDHEIRKKSWSQQKHATLYKPHLIVTTKGDVIHGGNCH